MLKIITKFFKKPEEIDNSTVEIKLELPEKTKTELFDEAVKIVVKDKLYRAVKEELVKLCYTVGEYDRRMEIIKKLPSKYFTKDVRDKLASQYEGLEFEYYGAGEYFIVASFNLDRLINNIIEGAI